MNLHLLRLFHAVAETGSFSKAAAALFISQPAVSKGVRELEEQLGLTLILRSAGGGRSASARGVVLTDSGEALFEHARGIFALERTAADEAQRRAEGLAGRLAIGASTTIAAYWLSEILAEFMRKRPEVDFQLRVGNTRTVARWIIECRVDAALVEGPVDDARIAVRRWRDDELRILARPDLPVARKRNPTVADLQAQVWLQREAGSGTRAVSDAITARLGITPARVLEMGSNEAIARGVAHGLGLAVLPLRVVRELLMLREIKPIRHPGGEALLRPLLLLQLKSRPPSPAAQKFIKLLKMPQEESPRTARLS